MPRQEFSSLRQGLVGAWCPSLGIGGATVADRSGYNRHGTLANPSYVASGTGSAILFGGSASQSSMAASPATVFGSSATFSVWVKRRTATPTLDPECGAWCVDSSATAGGTHYPYSSGLAYIRTFRTLRVVFSPLSSVDRTLWHNVCITTDGSLWRLYQAGLLATSTAAQATVNLSVFLLGRSLDGGSNNWWFDGQMDDARLYNRALTLSEISLLASRRGIGLTPLPDRGGGLPRKLSVNVGGDWRAADAYVRTATDWRLSQASVNVGGTWK